MFVYRYAGDDVIAHRLCAPCWNAKKLTMVLHKRHIVDERFELWCPECGWKATLR